MSGGRKMKSAVFYGKHDIKVEEVEMPQLGNQDVLIKVMACVEFVVLMSIFMRVKRSSKYYSSYYFRT